MPELNYEVIQDGGVPIKAWIKGVLLEDEARRQVLNLSRLPFIHKHVALMPDAHSGKGSTIGSVIATVGAIIPAAVGVDLGCGMTAVKTSINATRLPDNLAPLRALIEAKIPHGRSDHGGPNDKGARQEIPAHFEALWQQEFAAGWTEITEKHPALIGKHGHVNHINHLGTLGTGNHFIEVCLDEEDNVWLMLHSGSRGVGNRIGTYFIELAKRDMAQYFINLPDEDLAYLPEGSRYFQDYMQAVEWAQSFARMNRVLMLAQAHAALAEFLKVAPEQIGTTETAISCHHNYVQRESHFGKNVLVTRKGAVRAREGDFGIIPGSMGVGSYIVRGKGNPESFHSCSHGAGRTMSRTKARQIISLEKHARDTAGIECRKDAEVLDESPSAYKPLEDVMKAQTDLVEIMHKLRPLVCVKG